MESTNGIIFSNNEVEFEKMELYALKHNIHHTSRNIKSNLFTLTASKSEVEHITSHFGAKQHQ